MPAIQIIDRIAYDAAVSNIRFTPDGYMVATPRVARTGIQLYRGSEVGMPTMDVVRVYRPEGEVFSKDSLATYGHKPITNDHPPKPVNAANWKDYSVGAADGEVLRDGEFVRIPMVVMDAKTIQDMKDGKSEFSVGYSTELKWEAGVAPVTGEAYDAIQTSIRVNHIAIVDAARGGSKLKLGDNTAPALQTPTADADADEEETDEMSDAQKKVVSVMVDGISLEMGDTAAAIVTKSLKDMADKLNASTAQVTTLTSDAAKLKADHEAAIAKVTTDAKTALDAALAKVATLEKQVADNALTPAKLDKLVQDRAIVFGKAKTLLGDKLVVDGKTEDEVMRQVVDAKMGDAAKGWSTEQVKISFDTLTAGVKLDAATVSTGVTDTRAAFSAPAANVGDKAKLYNEADKKLENRWKNAGATAAA